MDDSKNMHNYSLECINVPLDVYLQAFRKLNETVCFRVIPDKPDKAFSGHKVDCVLEELFESEYSAYNELREHNERGRGIFYAVNKGGHSDADITEVKAQFVEMDDVPLEEQLKRVQEFPLEPSIIVKTRKSLHVYWLMKNAQVARFRHIQKQLVAHFGGDPACVNESRVMRVPTFFHHKQEPILVGCIKFNPELRYTQEQLAEHLPEIESDSEPTSVAVQKKKPNTEIGNQNGLYHVGKSCEFFKFCKKNALTLPEPLWYAKITNLAVFRGGVEAIHKISKPHPKYTPEETDKKIEHFRKSGTNPMTCKSIADKGFKCPKLGKCKVKSPAGLAFIPLTVDELKKLLLKIEKMGEMADNTLLAEQFISDYLFNVSPSVAEAFINHNISKHFDFKGSDKRPLLLHYREISKAYVHHYENEKSKSELPLWYRRNKLGDLHFMSGVLAEWLSKEIYAIYCTEQYYFYENGVYKPRTEKDAKAIVQTHLFPTESTMNQINDAEGQWQLRIRTEVNEINPNPYIINCTNGLYNVMDDTFGDHNPKVLSTVQMKARYMPDSKCDLWLKFLHSVLNEPEINLMQEIFGYLLVPITSAQKSFILCGKANTGKSTILRAMQELLLGADNVSSIPLQNLSERFQVAELFGKMANIFADLPDKSITDVGMFKAVTGEDFISADRKYKDTINFKPFARFFMSCNSMARNYGDRSEAFYRRLIIISFSKLVPEEKKDPQLLDKLRKEADGILWWAIQGLKRLIANNYRFSETDKTKAEVQKYKLQNNNVLAFVLEHCVIEEGAVSSRRELYDAYKEFCSDNGKPTSKQNFNAWICDADPAKITLSEEAVTRARIFKGIRLM